MMSFWPTYRISLNKTGPETELKIPGALGLEAVPRCTVGRLGPPKKSDLRDCSITQETKKA